ncbi:MAG: tRNA glutamyl-Q(34) synthetase GluQRS [Desulfuromusa sp.]|jgi:glutamyl-Q tRNA(Asp) synthetase|nr:tRNA glutamyl-Q(34) synthetase GluQRS [Desulfuromusa sp.]
MENLSQSNRPLRLIVGRFAPSPTGPLHFGTLLAALGSYLAAKCLAGHWLLRIEDLDPPRVIPGAAEAMVRLLEQLGFEWDGAIVYQSKRFERYRQILVQLRTQGQVFDCSCTRREILASAPHPGEGGPIYPGTCRNGICGNRPECAVRLRVTNENISFYDGVMGKRQQNLETDVGDFVLHRVDGLFAYQLAVVVDDIDSGVTQVVRGADLLSSTPRQIYLYRCLGAAVPEYFHLPLAFGNNGQKLSKRHGDFGLVTAENGANMLWRALEFLGQSPPNELLRLSSRELLYWGLQNFSAAAIPSENRIISFS